MARRLGYLEQPVIEEIQPPKEAALSGLQSLSDRLKFAGGWGQQGRMVLGKARTLDRALMYSYAGVDFKIVQSTTDKFRTELARGLIEPDKLKQDYDDKILTTPWKSEVKAGDVIEWVGTNSFWIVYLQELNEIAYFQSALRRCQYTIDWLDAAGEKHSTYAAVRGPVETKIDFIQKQGISVDEPNHTLNILIPKTDEALKYFRRYAKFYLKGCSESAPNVCWRVEGIDWVGIPGVLEINATEYYANEVEDDVKNGLVGGLIEQPQDPNEDSPQSEVIVGETFIKPKCQYNYTATTAIDAEWYVDIQNLPIKFAVNPNNPKQCGIYWLSVNSGEFEIKYGGFSKKIVVESLF